MESYNFQHQPYKEPWTTKINAPCRTIGGGQFPVQLDLTCLYSFFSCRRLFIRIECFLLISFNGIKIIQIEIIRITVEYIAPFLIFATLYLLYNNFVDEIIMSRDWNVLVKQLWWWWWWQSTPLLAIRLSVFSVASQLTRGNFYIVMTNFRIYYLHVAAIYYFNAKVFYSLQFWNNNNNSYNYNKVFINVY